MEHLYIRCMERAYPAEPFQRGGSGLPGLNRHLHRAGSPRGVPQVLSSSGGFCADPSLLTQPACLANGQVDPACCDPSDADLNRHALGQVDPAVTRRPPLVNRPRDSLPAGQTLSASQALLPIRVLRINSRPRDSLPAGLLNRPSIEPAG